MELMKPLTGAAVITSSTAPAIEVVNVYDATSGNLTPTLPALSTVGPSGRLAVAKYHGDTSANTITVSCSGSDTFQYTSMTSVTLRVPGEYVELQKVTVSGTARWSFVGSRTPVSSLDSRYQAKDAVYAITDGAGFQIAPANGSIQTITLGAARTPTGSFTAGQSVVLHIAATSYAVTWTDSSLNPTWVGGSAPVLSSTLTTVVALWKVGSTVYGSLVGYA